MERKLILIRFIHASQTGDTDTLRTIAKQSTGRTLPKSKGTVAAALRLAMRNASFSRVIEETAARVLQRMGTSSRNYPLHFVAGMAWDIHPTWSGELGLQWMLEDYARVVFHERRRQKGGLMQVVAKLDNLDNNADRRTRLQNAPRYVKDEDQLKRLTAALQDIAQPMVQLVAAILYVPGRRGGKFEEMEKVVIKAEKSPSRTPSTSFEPSDSEPLTSSYSTDDEMLSVGDISDADSDMTEDMSYPVVKMQKEESARDKLARIVNEANRTKQNTNSLRDRYLRLLGSSSS